MYLCFDIGGTSIKYGIFRKEGELVGKSNTLTTPKNTFSTNHILISIKKIIENYMGNESVNISGICISSAGIINKKEGIVLSAGETIPYFSGTNFKQEIEKSFNITCTVENDVNCALLGEVWKQNLTEKNAFCLTIGTGIGGSYFYQKKILCSQKNSTGEIGYMFIDSSGKNYQELGNIKYLIDTINLDFPEYKCITGHDVIDLLKTNHSIYKSIDKWLLNIAKGIINIQYTLDPDIFIIGGGIMENEELILRLNDIIQSIIHPNFKENIRLSSASLGNNAGMIGALYHYNSQKE